ncbi:hypothetical protein ACFL20_07380 [Spirochaetota bacterium]
MTNESHEKEYDDEVYDDSYYTENYDEEELKDEEGFEDEEDKGEDKVEKNDEDEDEYEDEEDDIKKVHVSFACDDCDYRWDDIVTNTEGTYNYDDENADLICPMCGSMNINQI